MTLFQNMGKGLLPARLTVDKLYDLVAAGVLAEGERLALVDGTIVPMAGFKAYARHDAVHSLIPAVVIRLDDID
jgi:hypothetical protein